MKKVLDTDTDRVYTRLKRTPECATVIFWIGFAIIIVLLNNRYGL